MSKGKKVRSVVVVNAAVLLEAQTEGRYNEVWLCMVPFETVIFETMLFPKLSIGLTGSNQSYGS